MKLKLSFILIVFFITITAQSKNDLNSEEKEYISKFIYPIKTFNPDERDNSDLLILNKLIGNSKIVGLGESTHGSSEVYQMKYRISEYLIANKNFNVFSLEANMPESFLMNQYIREEKGDPKDILKGMYFWLWQTEETLTFVEWLKKYNENHHSKVFFDGFDMQFAKGAVDQIRKTYQENHLSEQEINDLETALKENNRGFRTYSKKSQKTIAEYLFLIQQKSISIKNPEEKLRFLQNVDIIRQYSQLNFIRRDQFMAENIKWLKENYLNSKVIASAHNYHIAKLKSDRMGYWLNEMYDKDFVNFGFAFYEGTYSASMDGKLGTYNSEKAGPRTLEYKLNSLNIPIFILDLKAIKKDGNKLGNWILKDILFRKTGSGTDKNEFIKTNVANSFDYLIFINKSTNSKLLTGNSK
ncbi:erythromycin esterase family protein [Chryseobacterium jejuense]|uniref:erythromycin esterase family protein n=1 Tax=Chryseobacterium jejuense TaxID=445960 RepID=UPI001AE8A627|nr:erythromycin esterase family protein [Chryseobacterium jejuense]MBP2618122.1 erythromycin esterase [Chryseobacterium jejuense]